MIDKKGCIVGAVLLGMVFAHAELTLSETRVVDDFNRRVGASSPGTMGTDVWINGFSGGSQWGISENQAFSNLRKGAVGLLINKALTATSEFTLTAEITALSDKRWSGLVFNYTDEQNYYCFRFKSGTGNWDVQAIKNGSKSRLGAAGKLAVGIFKSNASYTLTVSSATSHRIELSITETASGAKVVSDSRSAEDAAEKLPQGFCGLFQITPGNELVHFDNFSLEIFPAVVFGSPTELSFAPIFNDGSVLQCEMPVNIWGTAGSGEKVTVSFAGQMKSTVADSSNHWKIVLDPMPASSEPQKLTISSSNDNRQSSIGNVLVGEVWLASGQSNMVQPLKNSHNGLDRLAKTIPEIHFVIVPQKTGLPVAQSLTPDELAWKSFAPETNTNMASVAFYFAEQIQRKTSRHVGIIQSSYGGTPCEAWTPQGALAAYSELEYLSDEIGKGLASGKTKSQWLAEIDDYKKARKKWQTAAENNRPAKPAPVGRDNPWSQQSPAVLYENMIAPLIPYTTRGVIWYQGEANAGRPDEYRVLFPAMIDAWRAKWARPDWPFFFVQLAAYGHPSPLWKELCVAQAFVRDTTEHTGMAVAVDCGDKKNIHPPSKQPVGERLARLALDQVYGQNVISRGPVFQTLEKNAGRVWVRFQGSEKGLKTSDGKDAVPGFELAGSDRRFLPATARITSADTVEVFSPSVSNPAFVRYAWDNFPEPSVTLQNSADLPAEPFKKRIL